MRSRRFLHLILPLAVASMLASGATAGAMPVPTAPVSPFGSPACAATHTADERLRCEATEQAREEATGAADDQATSLDRQWRRAVDDSHGLHVGELVPNRVAALVLGLIAFVVAVRHQRRSRRRAR